MVIHRFPDISIQLKHRYCKNNVFLHTIHNSARNASTTVINAHHARTTVKYSRRTACSSHTSTFFHGRQSRCQPFATFVSRPCFMPAAPRYNNGGLGCLVTSSTVGGCHQTAQSGDILQQNPRNPHPNHPTSEPSTS